MQVLTAAQSRESDRAAIAGGISGSRLMANAAAAVVRVLERDFAAALAGPALALCGRGNNGGDGLVVARLLAARGVAIEAVLLGEPAALRGEAAEAWAALLEAAPQCAHIASGAAAWGPWRARLGGTALLLDAILGTGLEAPPRGFLAEVVRDANCRAGAAARVAIDLPSGLPADGEFAPGWEEWDWSAVFAAGATVTFTAPKIGQLCAPGAEHCGRLYVLPIGMAAAGGAPEVRLTTAGALRDFAAPRPPDSHKGRYGHVLVVGGSLGKSGAAAMAAAAALRTGAGLVTAAVPRSVQPLVAAYRPELMTEALAETSEGTLAAALAEQECWRAISAGATVLALGPGVSAQPETAATVRRLIARAQMPWVLDADGLNAFAGRRDQLRAGAAGGVLTPHPGEMARLLGATVASVQTRRMASARALARETGAVVVLKGFRTVVAAPGGGVWINPTGNPGMATGGSGDVLTGVVAGLLAQFPDADRGRVAAAAVYLHGLAADLAAAETGEMALVATDITAHLPAALRQLATAPGEAEGLVLDLKGPERPFV